jgi:hypothetical protein
MNLKICNCRTHPQHQLIKKPKMVLTYYYWDYVYLKQDVRNKNYNSTDSRKNRNIQKFKTGALLLL